MEPKVIREYPPIIEELRRSFPIAGRAVLFAWGDRIYNPAGIPIPGQLMAHETLHCTRQLNEGVERWWDRYIADADFRRTEELWAHWAEYHWLVVNAPNRHARRGALAETAKRFASPLYGPVVTRAEAKRMLRLGASLVAADQRVAA